MTIRKIIKKLTIVDRIYDMLKQLEVNDSIDKIGLINNIYGRHDYFVSRSFDVNYSKAKNKLIKEEPDRQFRCIKKRIVRQS